MKKRTESYEIDLIELITNIYKRKLHIAAITIFFITFSVIIHYIFKSPLSAKTNIVPITIFEENLYTPYNISVRNFNKNKSESESESESDILYLKEINEKYLLNLFLNELQTKKNIIEAIKKYEFIDKKKFNNEDEYLEAVEKKALKLNLSRPINADGSQRGQAKLNWTIEFEINDPKKWEEALSFVNNKINDEIQNYLKKSFNISLNNLKLLNQFEIEDLNNKIDFSRSYYENKTRNYLAFLNEQKLIAKKLDIKNDITSNNNNIRSSNLNITLNYQTEPPSYYKRGYLMIEKEIELIKNRSNEQKDAFTENLIELKKQKKELLEDKSLERIEKLFNSSPIFIGNDFKAAEIIYKDTEYENSFTLIKTIITSCILGIIFGVFYVFLSIAIQQRK